MNIGSVKRDSAIEQIEALLESGNCMSVDEVAGALGCCDDFARKLMKRMQEAGMVEITFRIVRGKKVSQFHRGDVSVIKREPVKVVVRRDWAVAALFGA